MLKLLMADDEPLVLVGLQSMLNWGDHGIEICGTARNGGQAMELIEKYRPDIVITDIRMPIASGLELMLDSREKFGRIPLFIILTSVEEYQHVRQAMSGQAVDYLVKLELTPDILAQSITKAKDILHGLGRTTRGEASGQHGMQSLYDSFFTGLFSGQFENEEHLRQQSRQLGIDFSHEAYVVCYCRLDSPSADGANTEHLMNLYASTTRMTKETIAQYMACHITSVDLRHFVVTFCLSRQQAESHEPLLRDVLQQTIRLIKNYFNVDMACAVGTKADAPPEISNSYAAARKAMTDQNRPPVHFYQADRKKSHIVELVKEYIRQNLDKQLTLTQAADVFGYSPKYISLLFAKHADHSFVEYINAEKIARAKEMLLTGNVKIYEISDRLGFESAFYFSKVFKKHTGYSPRDFAQKNR
ncbi:MAG: response regulator [Clostridiales bacterium]|jgi:two-component system response regulator YesN|nr:response regulator [Clostridiales bacterium]